jgi:DNA-binding CsgD family transcriptional regulator
VQRRSSRANVSASPELNPDFEMALLSDRELEVLEAIGRGFSTRECAERLHVSIKTIEAHQAHIKAKLKLQDANRLRRFAAVWVARERPLPLDHGGTSGSHLAADAHASAPHIPGGEGGTDHAGTAQTQAGPAIPNVQAAPVPPAGDASGGALASDKTPGQAN